MFCIYYCWQPKDGKKFEKKIKKSRVVFEKTQGHCPCLYDDGDSDDSDGFGNGDCLDSCPCITSCKEKYVALLVKLCGV